MQIKYIQYDTVSYNAVLSFLKQMNQDVEDRTDSYDTTLTTLMKDLANAYQENESFGWVSTLGVVILVDFYNPTEQVLHVMFAVDPASKLYASQSYTPVRIEV